MAKKIRPHKKPSTKPVKSRNETSTAPAVPAPTDPVIRPGVTTLENVLLALDVIDQSTLYALVERDVMENLRRIAMSTSMIRAMIGVEGWGKAVES